MMSRAKTALLMLAVALASGCAEKAPPPASGTAPAAAPAPRAAKVLDAKRGTPVLDGKLDQPVWHAASRTEPFVAERGARPVPHTEARAAWDDDALYLELYVADDELLGTDHVRIELDGDRSIEASPSGKLTCKFQGADDCNALGIRSGFDVDGDVDLDAKEDEEWSVIVAVPWRTLGVAERPKELPVVLRRGDSSLGKPVREIWSRGPSRIRLVDG
ncbi:MAG: hypothetical protein U0263_11430 [Polyangiaceae bacterium]